MENLELKQLLITLVVLLVISFVVIIRQRKMLKKHEDDDISLVKRAYFDLATELPNRKNIEIIIDEQIARTSRHKKTFLVIAVKILNYAKLSLRLEADDISIEIATRLLESIRDEDSLARVKEDEFVIVFNEYLEEENKTILIERIETLLTQSYMDTTVIVETSVGISEYPKDAISADGLIKKATQNLNI